MTTLNLKRKIFETPGYSQDVTLTPDELAVFRREITRQWLDVIGQAHPELASRFEAVGVENYHELAHLIEHEKLWPKGNRCLPKDSCGEIKKLPFLQTLRQELGEFDISTVFHGGTHEADREEIYWRLVRPNASTDVGSLHADKWFHKISGMEYCVFPAGAVTVKIWIPIFSQPGRNGLMIVPDSHLREWRYHAVLRGSDMKPQIDEDVAAIGAQLMKTEPGNMLIFNEGTLHGGALNTGDQSRVSVEITMVFPASAAA